MLVWRIISISIIIIIIIIILGNLIINHVIICIWTLTSYWNKISHNLNLSKLKFKLCLI
jgi:hypothetical protein